MFNVLTGELSAHTPEIRSTIRLGGAYDPEAKCPIFLKYLDDVLPGSEHELLQEIFGYFLVPVNKAQKSFIVVGDSDTGKSTLLYLVQDVLLTEDNVSTLPWQALNDRFSTFQLFGKLANIFADLPTENLKDTGTFKAITGEDSIMGERKHKDGFSFKPFVRLMFSCNLIPKSYNDRSQAYYNRLLILRLDRVIPDDMKDPNLKEKLMAEQDGILMWSLEGLKRLMANNYKFSVTDSVKAEIRKYKSENSTVLAFVEEYCECDPAFESLRDDVYAVYVEYCKSGSHSPVSKTRFNNEVEQGKFAVRSLEKTTRRKAWKGLRLRDGV
jgi:putative DNA primase/helicase